MPFKSFFKDNFIHSNTPTTNSKPRIEFIDLAKGICILLVVFYHNGLWWDTPAIKALRMPLYFILSGLFFKDYGGFIPLLTKKLNKILIPFLFFVGISILLGVIISSDSVLDNLLMPFYKPDTPNLAVWFLICLFWVNLIYFWINKIGSSLKYKTILVFAGGILGYTLSHYHIYLPLFISSSLSALPFFFMGILLRKTSLLYGKINHFTSKKQQYSTYLLIFMGWTTLLYCIYKGTPYLDFKSNFYSGNPVEIYIVSIFLVIGLLLICKAIVWLPVISYLGRYSIIILGLHIPVMDYAYIVVYFLTGHLFSKIEMIIFTISVCWLAIPICRKFFPKFTAQEDLLPLFSSNKTSQRKLAL